MVERKHSSSRRDIYEREEFNLAPCAPAHCLTCNYRERWVEGDMSDVVAVTKSCPEEADKNIVVNFPLTVTSHSQPTLNPLLSPPSRIPELSSRTYSVSPSLSTTPHGFLCYPVSTWPSPGWTSHVYVVFSCGALITKQSPVNMLRSLLLLAS
ncbi:hypothetical protein NA56DRAFT_696872 [Hyaloscypha hepaticicola]|uniref:Uncharacterized protein n=1 Tax=Hyaloscypha hepaticicola TaxID=2082293 RepID=A0A2J6QNM4_9HELO|nr:hypothetical protein NA56DRAFT_696872 [Hyaloscypha hepaticicola]